MSQSGRADRLLSLDAMRGVAVFLMIEQHMGVWLWNGERVSSITKSVLVGFNALGGMAAPLFVSLAGMGSALFVAKARPRRDKTMVSRGLVLMGFGLALNLITPSWFTWGSWFVLHMMGFAMALAPLWRRMSTRQLVVAIPVILILTVVVQNALDTPGILRNPRMRDVSLPGGALRLAIAESQFPILPWLSFYLAGFVSGRWIEAGHRNKMLWLGLALLGGGAALAGVYFSGASFARAGSLYRAFKLHLGFFPAGPPIVGMLLGGALLLVRGAMWLETKVKLRADTWIVALGRGSLTLLMLHVWLFREASRPVGLWHGLSAIPALLAIFAFTGIAIVACKQWQKIEYRYGAEWLLRKLAL